MITIKIKETHKSPIGEPRYRVVCRHGRFIQGFPSLTAAEASEIDKALAAREEAKADAARA